MPVIGVVPVKKLEMKDVFLTLGINESMYCPRVVINMKGRTE